MARRGKTIAVSCAALAVTALVGGAVLLRERLLEEWYLRKLRSADEDEVLRAAEMLGKLGSTRAVPEMLGLVARLGGVGKADSTSDLVNLSFVPDLSDLEEVVPQDLPFPLDPSARPETSLGRFLREATGYHEVLTTGSLYLRGNASRLFLVPEDDRARVTRLLTRIRKVCASLDALGESALPAVERVAADPRLPAATRAFADCYLARRRRNDPALRLREEGGEVSLQQRTSAALPGSSGSVYLSIADVTRGQVRVWVTLASGKTLVEDRSLSEGGELPFTLGGKDYVLRLKDLRNKLIGEDSAIFEIVVKPRD